MLSRQITDCEGKTGSDKTWPPIADPPKPPPEWSPAANKVQNWTEVIRQDAAPKTSSPALPAASVTTYAQRNNAKNSIGSR